MTALASFAAPGLAPAPLALTTPWPIVVAAYLDATIDSPHTRRALPTSSARRLHLA